ncbi:hypothetical protein C0L86_10505 [Streptomyces sp. SCA2-2]|nr:hypothetical protein C0L86_10505 [Streptomyces sp. SCA2-2]
MCRRRARGSGASRVARRRPSAEACRVGRGAGRGRPGQPPRVVLLCRDEAVRCHGHALCAKACQGAREQAGARPRSRVPEAVARGRPTPCVAGRPRASPGVRPAATGLRLLAVDAGAASDRWMPGVSLRPAAPTPRTARRALRGRRR